MTLYEKLNETNGNTFDTATEVTSERNVHETKKYTQPKLVEIGAIADVTLASGVIPSGDSGTGFSPS